MGYQCCVDKCSSKSNRTTIRHHAFPRDKTLRDKWVAFLNKGYNFQVRKSHRICTLHFEKKYFIRTFFGKIRLKPNAIPSILVNPERSLFECKNHVAISDCVPTQSLLEHSEEIEYVNCYLSDVNVEHLEDSPSTSILDPTTYYSLSPHQECSEKKELKMSIDVDNFTEQDLESPSKRKMFWIKYQENKNRIQHLKKEVQALRYNNRIYNDLVHDLLNLNTIGTSDS